jgi:tetratricopeptide (TPR) repeat protein
MYAVCRNNNGLHLPGTPFPLPITMNVRERLYEDHDEHMIRHRHRRGTPPEKTQRRSAFSQAVILLFAIIACLAYWTFERNRLYDNALSLWEDTAVKSPDKARVQYNLGTAYYHKGRMNDAIEALKRASALDPNHVRAHFNLGMAYVREGRFDEAIRSFQEALRRDPNFVDALFNLGSVYNLQKRLQEAVQAYREVLQVEPENITARMNLAKTYSQMGRTREARTELEMVLQYQPSNAEAAAMVRGLETANHRPHH